MSSPGMFGGYQETSRESVVTSVSDGQSGGEATEQREWKKLETISGLNTTRAIEKLWSDEHSVTVQHRLGTIAVH